jgi:O-antigen/teichoic acid export membrane protein
VQEPPSRRDSVTASPPARRSLVALVSAPMAAIIANSGWLLFDRVLRLGLAIVIGAWVARYLGPSNYGQLAYVMAIAAMFQAVATLGLDSILVRDVSHQPEQAPLLLGSVLRMRLAAGALGWCGTVAIVWFLRPGDNAALLLASIFGSSLLLYAAEVVDLWFQSQSRSRLTVWPRALAYMVVAALKVALVFTQAPVWAFAAAVPCEAALVAVALSLAYRRNVKPRKWAWDSELASRMLRESWPLLLSALSVIIYMRIDQVMLSELAGDTELGMYSAMLPFSQAWHVVPLALCASALPQLTRLRELDEAAYWRQLSRLTAALAWAGIAAAAVTAASATWLVQILLGPKFAPAAEVLRWHVLTNVFVFVGVAQGLVIVNERTPLIALWKTLLGLVTSVAMNWWLIPRWGAVGSAWAALASQFVSAVLSNAVFSRRLLELQMNAIFRPLHV